MIETTIWELAGLVIVPTFFLGLWIGVGITLWMRGYEGGDNND